jgi:hypothetical protein
MFTIVLENSFIILVNELLAHRDVFNKKNNDLYVIDPDRAKRRDRRRSM